jgi:leucyl/phenylalanyl-tRNA--protein transferase
MNIKKSEKTSKIEFPDPWNLPEESDGLIYVGGSLEVETLASAYSQGIFPWPLEEQYPLFWFCPEPRGVIDFADVHVPQSLEKLRKKNRFHFTVNKVFHEVIHACALQKRPGQDGTWIIPELIPAYIKFHQAGFAHSIECWEGETLVGGLYGVCIQGVFSGESMFHSVPNASKLCLLETIERLKNHGMEWMDIQMLTPVTEHLGGHYISRRDFLLRLREAHAKNPPQKLSL